MGGGLSAEAMLAAWEAGARRGPLDRALVLLWAGGQGDGAADLALTDRDRQLLELRSATFGPRLDCKAACPDCGAEVELSVDAEVLADALTVAEPSMIAADGREIVLRPLTSRDLAAAQGIDAEALPDFLRDRLASDSRALRPLEIAALDAEIEAQAQAAETVCRLSCPDCDTEWREALDIGALLWDEVEAAAWRTLSEVAELARAFGWTEAEVLALSSARRSAYLSLARVGG